MSADPEPGSAFALFAAICFWLLDLLDAHLVTGAVETAPAELAKLGR